MRQSDCCPLAFLELHTVDMTVSCGATHTGTPSPLPSHLFGGGIDGGLNLIQRWVDDYIRHAQLEVHSKNGTLQHKNAAHCC